MGTKRFPGHKVLGRILLAVSFLMMQAMSTTTRAQDVPLAPTSSSISEEPVAKEEGLGGFFGKVAQSIDNAITGSRDTLQIEELNPGIYEKSNEAIGDEKDIEESRITRGLLSVPSFTNYANEVLGKLKTVSKVEKVPGQIIVVANDQLDAGSTADGNIYLSSGYIRELKCEDELAALLAHELAHVLLKHHDSNAFSRVQKQISTLAIAAMSVRNALDKASGGGASNTLTPGQNDAIRKMELLIKLNDNALHPAWNRRQESEADRLGMDLMIRAGYSYQDGLLSWLEAVAKWDEILAKKKAEDALKKQAALQAMIESGKLDDSTRQGLTFAFDQVMGQLAATHEEGETRMNDIDAYFIKVYKEKVPKATANRNSYQAASGKQDVKPIIDAYSKVYEARNLVADRKYDQALRILKPLLAPKSLIGSHALPNQLMFEASRGSGRSKDAELYLARSLKSEHAVWEVYDSAATFQKDRGDLVAVRKVGQSAFQKFAGAPSAYPKLIALYRRNGLSQDMTFTLSQCLLNQPEKRDQCIEASK